MSWLAACRALDRRVWVLAVARLVVTAGYSMVMPFLAMHLAVERHVPWVVVGLIWLVAGGCGAVAQWLAGELADRLGRRPLMLAAMIARALNLAAMGLAVAGGSGPGSILVIALLTVLNAVLRGCFDPVAAAMVADLAPPQLRVAAYSLQRVGINLGWAAGPAAAGLAGDVSYATLFYASAPLTLMSAITVAAIGESQASGERRAFTLVELLAFARDRTLLRFLAATFAFFILQVQLYQTASIYAASVLKLDRAEVSTMFTLNGAMVVLLQLPAIHYIQRLGIRRALMLGTLGYAVSYAAVGLATGQLTLLACIAAVTLAEIITSPAQQAAITALAPPGRTGAYTGLYGLCGGRAVLRAADRHHAAVLPAAPRRLGCAGPVRRPRLYWLSRRDAGGFAAGVPSREVWNPLRVPRTKTNWSHRTYTSLWRPRPSRDVSSSAPAPWEAPESRVSRFPPSFGTALQS